MSPVFERNKADWNQRWRTISFIALLWLPISTCAGIVAPMFVVNSAAQQFATLQNNFRTIEQGILRYQKDTGVLPGQLGDLFQKPMVKAWKGPYLERPGFLDPWHQPIIYRVPGKAGKPFDLVSLGADGKPGGTSKNQDVSIWKPVVSVSIEGWEIIYLVFSLILFIGWVISLIVCLTNGFQWLLKRKKTPA